MVFGPAGSIISPEGSISINKTYCYCQDALPRMFFLGCWWYNDMGKWPDDISDDRKKLFINHLLGSKPNMFGCQKYCVRQLPAFAFTRSKHVRRQREAYGYNQNTSHQHLPGWAEKEGTSSCGRGKPLETNQLLCRAGWGAEMSSSPPERDHHLTSRKRPDSAQFCRHLHQAVQRLRA